MNDSITTETLKNICRICLEEGQYDISEKLLLNNSQISDTVTDSFKETLSSGNMELSVKEMLSFILNWEYEILGLSSELPTICQTCLEECLCHYMYYNKLKKANEKLVLLYQEASDRHNNIESDIENVDGKNVNLLTDETIYSNTVDDEAVSPKNSTDEEIKLEHYFDCFDGNASSSSQEKQNYAEEFNYVQTEPIELSLSNSEINGTISENQSAVLENFIITSNNCLNYEESLQETPQRSSSPHKKKAARRKKSSPNLPIEKKSSLIVSQFVASTSAILVETTGTTVSGNDVEIRTNQTSQEVSSIDFTAVEIKSEDLQKMDGHEYMVSFQNQLLTTTQTESSLQKKATSATVVNESSVFLCKYCPQAYSNEHYLMEHMRKSHVCKFCTRAFVVPQDLYKHLKEAHSEHKCAICEKKLSSHSNLRAHIRRVHGVHLPAQVALLDYHVRNTMQEDMDIDVQSFLDDSKEEHLDYKDDYIDDADDYSEAYLNVVCELNKVKSNEQEDNSENYLPESHFD